MKIAALYQFKQNDPYETKELLEIKSKEWEIIGMLMIAAEGINGTIAGEAKNLNSFLDYLTQDLRFDNLELKFSSFDGNQTDLSQFPSEFPFQRMRISVRKEIVTFGIPDLPMETRENIHSVDPKEWNEIISREDTLVIDTRNDYEVQIGSFKNAINPKTETFRDFPAFIGEYLQNQNRCSSEEDKSDHTNHKKKRKNIAIFCTGGIRCEKASMYLSRLQQFEEIYQLKGGILKYLETIPASPPSPAPPCSSSSSGDNQEKEKEKAQENIVTDSSQTAVSSLWEGECFVFDQRVSVGHGLVRGNYSLCRSCRHPLSKEEQSVENDFEEGIHCKYCLSSLTTERRKALEERQRQILLSKERQEKHLGYQHPSHEKNKKQNKKKNRQQHLKGKTEQPAEMRISEEEKGEQEGEREREMEEDHP
jgi:UPF0176 protein